MFSYAALKEYILNIRRIKLFTLKEYRLCVVSLSLSHSLTHILNDFITFN